MTQNPRKIRSVSSQIQSTAKQNRKQPTPAEAKLWNALRRRKLSGLKFRRQHPLGRFIVDFYCAQHKLVIEIDGAAHEHQQDYDSSRTQQLEIEGRRVLRFSNEQVKVNLETVLAEIEAALLV